MQLRIDPRHRGLGVADHAVGLTVVRLAHPAKSDLGAAAQTVEMSLSGTRRDQRRPLQLLPKLLIDIRPVEFDADTGFRPFTARTGHALPPRTTRPALGQQRELLLFPV
ncbi:hypothetical protein R4227_05985 [Gordonia amicalis]|nr:hypothetical protein [Gordonia amicalis]